jgi:hypothetical protein
MRIEEQPVFMPTIACYFGRKAAGQSAYVEIGVIIAAFQLFKIKIFFGVRLNRGFAGSST